MATKTKNELINALESMQRKLYKKPSAKKDGHFFTSVGGKDLGKSFSYTYSEGGEQKNATTYLTSSDNMGGNLLNIIDESKKDSDGKLSKSSTLLSLKEEIISPKEESGSPKKESTSTKALIHPTLLSDELKTLFDSLGFTMNGEYYEVPVSSVRETASKITQFTIAIDGKDIVVTADAGKIRIDAQKDGNTLSHVTGAGLDKTFSFQISNELTAKELSGQSGYSFVNANGNPYKASSTRIAAVDPRRFLALAQQGEKYNGDENTLIYTLGEKEYPQVMLTKVQDGNGEDQQVLIVKISKNDVFVYGNTKDQNGKNSDALEFRKIAVKPITRIEDNCIVFNISRGSNLSLTAKENVSANSPLDSISQFITGQPFDKLASYKSDTTGRTAFNSNVNYSLYNTISTEKTLVDDNSDKNKLNIQVLINEITAYLGNYITNIINNIDINNINEISEINQKIDLVYAVLTGLQNNQINISSLEALIQSFQNINLENNEKLSQQFISLQAIINNQSTAIETLTNIVNNQTIQINELQKTIQNMSIAMQELLVTIINNNPTEIDNNASKDLIDEKCKRIVLAENTATGLYTTKKHQIGSQLQYLYSVRNTMKARKDALDKKDRNEDEERELATLNEALKDNSPLIKEIERFESKRDEFEGLKRENDEISKNPVSDIQSEVLSAMNEVKNAKNETEKAEAQENLNKAIDKLNGRDRDTSDNHKKIAEFEVPSISAEVSTIVDSSRGGSGSGVTVIEVIKESSDSVAAIDALINPLRDNLDAKQLQLNSKKDQLTSLGAEVNAELYEINQKIANINNEKTELSRQKDAGVISEEEYNAKISEKDAELGPLEDKQTDLNNQSEKIRAQNDIVNEEQGDINGYKTDLSKLKELQTNYNNAKSEEEKETAKGEYLNQVENARKLNTDVFKLKIEPIPEDLLPKKERKKDDKEIIHKDPSPPDDRGDEKKPTKKEKGKSGSVTGPLGLLLMVMGGFLAFTSMIFGPAMFGIGCALFTTGLGFKTLSGVNMSDEAKLTKSVDTARKEAKSKEKGKFKEKVKARIKSFKKKFSKGLDKFKAGLKETAQNIKEHPLKCLTAIVAAPVMLFTGTAHTFTNNAPVVEAYDGTASMNSYTPGYETSNSAATERVAQEYNIYSLEKPSYQRHRNNNKLNKKVADIVNKRTKALSNTSLNPLTTETGFTEEEISDLNQRQKDNVKNILKENNYTDEEISEYFTLEDDKARKNFLRNVREVDYKTALNKLGIKDIDKKYEEEIEKRSSSIIKKCQSDKAARRELLKDLSEGEGFSEEKGEIINAIVNGYKINSNYLPEEFTLQNNDYIVEGEEKYLSDKQKQEIAGKIFMERGIIKPETIAIMVYETEHQKDASKKGKKATSPAATPSTEREAK